MKNVLLTLLAGSALFAQNYLWPTNASNNLTSSFCEYRPGHFHSAIDIKTWNREGYECYAIEDGTISRIRVSPFGYGKVLYLKLNDGRTAVYAHLKGFTDDLEQGVRRQQIANERYSIDWWPGKKVKKGQLLAYTGQTGIGVPHLHFEIRDSLNRPLNPLQFYPHIKDNIRPKPRKLLLIPMTEDSHIEGEFLPYELPLNANGKTITIPKPVKAFGKIGIAVEGYDQADGVHNRLGFYELRLYENGQNRFEMSYDIMRFSHTKQIERHIYYPWKILTGSRFVNLFRRPDTDLLAYKTKDDGLIDLKYGTKNIEIEVADYFGNRRTIELTLSSHPNNLVQISQSEQLNGNAYLKMTMPAQIAGLNFFSGNHPHNLNPVEYYEFLDWQRGEHQNEALLKVVLNAPQDAFLKARVELKNGGSSETLSNLRDLAETDSSLKATLWGKYIHIAAKGLTAGNKEFLKAISADSVVYPKLRGLYPDSYALLPARHIKNGPLKITREKHSEIEADTTFNMGVIYPERTSVFSLFDDSLQVVVPEDAVYDTLLFTFSKKARDSSAWEAPVTGSVYEINDGQRLIKRSYTLRLALADSSFYKQAAIFTVGRENRLSYSGGEIKEGYIETRRRSPGRYIIAADTSKPKVTLLSKKLLTPHKKPIPVQLLVKDELSGFNGDRDIRLEIDGRFIIAEWDPERDIVSALPHFELLPGEHTLTVSVTDRSGNQTIKEYPFTIIK